MSDILFSKDGWRYSFRVGGILRDGDKILLQKPSDDGYAIIGGHVSLGETTEQALIREFYEELHIRIIPTELIAVGEIFFDWHGPCHQTAFYYNVALTDGEELPEGIFRGYDEAGGERYDLDYIWVTGDDIINGLEIYPKSLKPRLIGGSGVCHFTENQL